LAIFRRDAKIDPKRMKMRPVKIKGGIASRTEMKGRNGKLSNGLKNNHL
jgi:hypothetical protein